jgi:hypothetical protein
VELSRREGKGRDARNGKWQMLEKMRTAQAAEISDGTSFAGIGIE